MLILLYRIILLNYRIKRLAEEIGNFVMYDSLDPIYFADPSTNLNAVLIHGTSYSKLKGKKEPCLALHFPMILRKAPKLS